VYGEEQYGYRYGYRSARFEAAQCAGFMMGSRVGIFRQQKLDLVNFDRKHNSGYKKLYLDLTAARCNTIPCRAPCSYSACGQVSEGYNVDLAHSSLSCIVCSHLLTDAMSRR